VKSAAAMIKEGIFGVYTTKEAIASPQVMKLTGFGAKSLGKVLL
jgi:hypothetical protein